MFVAREELLKGLDAVSVGLSASNQDGVPQGACFVFQGGRVITCKQELSCTAPSPLGKTVQGAAYARKLYEFLRKLTADELEITVEGERLYAAAKGDFAWCPLEAKVYMEYPQPPKEWKPLPSDFCEAVNTVGSCAGTERDKFIAMCVHVTKRHVEASDGYQACRWPLKTGFTSPSTMLLWDSLKHVVRAGAAEFAEGDSWTFFRNPAGVTLACRRYAYEFPSEDSTYEGAGAAVELPPKLEEACKKAKIFLDGDAQDQQVLVDLRAGRLELSGEGAEGGYERAPRKVNYQGPPLRFLISPVILAEVSNRQGRCEVTEDRLIVDGGRYRYVTCLSAPKTNGKSDANGEQEDQ